MSEGSVWETETGKGTHCVVIVVLSVLVVVNGAGSAVAHGCEWEGTKRGEDGIKWRAPASSFMRTSFGDLFAEDGYVWLVGYFTC